MTTNPFGFDTSFSSAACKPAAVKKTGAQFIIGYAGCADTRKNVSKATFQSWGAAGLWHSLVIENGVMDPLGGRATGVRQGNAIVAAAKALGYDVANCALFAAVDFDENGGSYAKVNAFCKGFASVVPVPGFYTDGDGIDYQYAHGGSKWVYWNSESTSFGKTSTHAHLVQIVGDKRSGALGKAVDVNTMLKPAYLMGETMFTEAQIAAIADARIKVATGSKGVITASIQDIVTRALRASLLGIQSGIWKHTTRPAIVPATKAGAVVPRIAATEKSVSKLTNTK